MDGASNPATLLFDKKITGFRVPPANSAGGPGMTNKVCFGFGVAAARRPK
jgi:hypothetical protein